MENIKVEDINRPLLKGEIFMVPCIVRKGTIDEIEMLNDDVVFIPEKIIFVTPIINHWHNDKENGQQEPHYHIDYRFLRHNKKGDFPKITNRDKRYCFGEKTRFPKNPNETLLYIQLPVINEDFRGKTSVSLISKSKLKHKCVYKGKCPHRGYDLSQVPPENGIITCPLHGLQFDSVNKKLVNQKSKQEN